MLNEEIRDPQIRLIDSDGTALGIVSSQEALNIAAERDLDLVKIAPLANPPVCKIMDYGKFLFEQQKREKEARKNQKVITIKEVKLSPKIEKHDFEVRLKSAEKFLQDGDKVKVSIRFRGRAMQFTSMGNDVMHEFAQALEHCAVVETKPKLEGRNMFMMLNAK